MSRRRISFALSSLSFILLILCLTSSCTAQENRTCYPSSCGEIHNISFPFRLKGDPLNCGHLFGELVCQNNRTILRIDSERYFYVAAINYDNFSVRIVDPGIEKDNCSSSPVMKIVDLYKDPFLNNHVAFINCPVPVNSMQYVVDTASCRLQNDTYVVFGDTMRVSDMEDSCSIRRKTLVSLHEPITDNTSLSDIHDGLAYGFELSWFRIFCLECDAKYRCSINWNHNVLHCEYRLGRTLFESLRDIWTSLRDIWTNHNPRNFREIEIIFGARFLCGIALLFAIFVCKWRRRHLSMYDTIEDFLQSQNNLMPIRYSYSNIKKMTKGFKDKLGEGGYGTVFKGKLISGPLVAIKLTGKSKATGQEFINEVGTIGRIHHVNVVQLIGFCAEGSKRALVYDFMPNGSLEKYIFPREGNDVCLSCEKMYDISLGVARGIEYLHRGCDMQILHFDIKPHNILLDENFVPKVSDFGLARLYPTDDSIVVLTAARGTMGYMAPELFYKNIGGVSYKADVYSFGMLLMEMAGRRKKLNVFADHSSQIYFPSWVYDQFMEGKDIEIGATTDEEMKMVKKMITVALWCIQMKPSDRPSMNKVVQMLEGDVELLHMPPKPFMCPQEMPNEDHKTNTIPEFPESPGDFSART